MSSRPRVNLPEAISFLYQLLALVSLALYPLFAWRWQGQLSGEQATAGWVIDFLVAYVTGLIYLGCSLWIYSLRRSDASGRAFSLFTAAAGTVLAGLYDTSTTGSLIPLWTVSLALTGGALFHFTLLFPEEAPILKNYPYLRWGVYVPSLILALAGLLASGGSRLSASFHWSSQLAWLYAGLAGIFTLGWTVVRRNYSASPIVREQARLILWGAAIAFSPLVAWFVLSTFRPDLPFITLLLLATAIFPILSGYAVLRYRLQNTDFLLSRITHYTLLSLLAAFGYALLVSGFSLVFGSAIPPDQPLLVGLMVFIFALSLQPVRERLQSGIDRYFFRGRALYQEHLQAFGRELTQISELGAILHLLRSTVLESLMPTQLHIFIRDPQTGMYLPAADESGYPTTDIRFPFNSVLVEALTRQRSALFMEGSDTLPLLLQAERARLALLGVQLFIPLPGQTRLIGWLALGPRRSGESYNNTDLRYLESLGDQTALAAERAQMVTNLERRVHEMDVLTRIAQGVNITLAFDDILELIYAQTAQLLPTRELRVVLKDESTQALYYAFYLENDERLSERENIPLKPGQQLEEAVIQSRQPVITDDFENECRSRGILAHAPHIFAWMGVPLNTGADTIGAISLGSRDPTTVFTEIQANLLQAIADQAAGAIVKGRLLLESERRARQLATLNDVGRSLTSTLEIKPLLHKILDSACEILNSQAGSLFTVDEQTGELIFEVTAGPVAAELVGMRLAPGTGMVGKAAQTALPVIANNVRQTSGWSDQTDRQTGFITRDLLVVPMQLHERVTGVIEIINKREGSPFNQDDCDLLATFASQAAVAIDNARLYTQTDQALTARVEELSVMQRIDRELNASLDLERVLRITLEWAMRQSRADAGLVGLLNEELRVLASQGYPDFDQPEGNSPQKTSSSQLQELPVLAAAIASGVPQSAFIGTSSSDAESGSHTSQSILEGAASQVAIPLRRRDQVIGAILLETSRDEVLPKETIDFLTRLSDHAAIAVTNAQLYADLQAANLAKSEFVSLVSHELKTPMTSIRGYTDLLAQGTVGPVTETQTQFLNTIRSNVIRMATLVSDLADVSRIEAGRMRLDFSAVSMADVIQEVVSSQQGQIDLKGQSLDVRTPPDLPPVWGDLNRVNQILTNLLSNAHKYTPEGGKLAIRAERSLNRSLNSSPNAGEVQGNSEVVLVRVQDSGYGIGPAEQGKIFQKFFRSEEAVIRDAPGTGLGLNITRHLVEMQGGRIWFESQPGEGTTFYFTIPVAN